MSSERVKLSLIFLFFFAIGFGILFFYTKQTSQKKAEERKVIATKSAFSLEHAPANSIKGDITTLYGDVKWESRVATEPAALINTTKIQQGEEIQTGDNGTISVSFPQIGNLKLFPKTNVQIAQSIPESFVLGQTKGTVSYEKSGTGNFSIRSYHLLTKIDSGKADMTVDDTLDEITIVVHTGSVTVGYNDSNNVSTIQTIQPGQTFIYDDSTRDTTIK